PLAPIPEGVWITRERTMFRQTTATAQQGARVSVADSLVRRTHAQVSGTPAFPRSTVPDHEHDLPTLPLSADCRLSLRRMIHETGERPGNRRADDPLHRQAPAHPSGFAEATSDRHRSEPRSTSS